MENQHLFNRTDEEEQKIEQQSDLSDEEQE